MASITSLPSGVSGSSLVLISTVTASSSSTVEFTSGIDSTYKEYQVHFTDVHPSGDGAALQVNFRDGSTAYDATKTTTSFQAQQAEADSTQFTYEDGFDLAQATGFQYINRNTGNDNDQATSGILHLFDPSSTTFVKHFISKTNTIMSTNKSENNFVAGYCNVTAAIDGVQFKMDSGTIDAGTFKLYGVV